jgi:hypothetical protein
MPPLFEQQGTAAQTRIPAINKSTLDVNEQLKRIQTLARARMTARQTFTVVSVLAFFSTLFSPQAVDAGEHLTKNHGQLIQVGPQRAIKTLADASKIAVNGDTVEVDAGDYVRDVAVWTQDDLSLKAAGGRVRLIAGGASAEAKAIWVIRGGKIQIEGFDFVGAAVSDRNGAGIRLEKGQLTIRACKFIKNENGVLTGSNPASTLDIENSEFGHNGFGDGQSHNLYVGAISRLSVTGSYFHHAKVGHLVKSRATENHIYYNRLTDEVGGQASYELEFPSGGVAYVVGNIIQQSSTTENPHVISFGAEGYRGPVNELYLINNTLVDNRPQNGVFLRIKPGTSTVVALNNLLVGRGKLESAGSGDYRNNFNVEWSEFILAAREDYRLILASKLRGKAIEPPTAAGGSLKPVKEYLHPNNTRPIGSGPLSPGAYQSAASF